MAAVVVQPPVHLFQFQGLVKPFQQAQLRRRPVLNPNVRILIFDVCPKPFSDERRAVVRHQKWRLPQRPVQSLGFLASQAQRVDRFDCTIAVGQVTGQQVTRVIIDRRHRIPPAKARNMQVRHVHLPQVVGPLRQQLVKLQRLMQLRLSDPSLLLQQAVLPPSPDRHPCRRPPRAGGGTSRQSAGSRTKDSPSPSSPPSQRGAVRSPSAEVLVADAGLPARASDTNSTPECPRPSKPSSIARRSLQPLRCISWRNSTLKAGRPKKQYVRPPTSFPMTTSSLFDCGIGEKTINHNASMFNFQVGDVALEYSLNRIPVAVSRRLSRIHYTRVMIRLRRNASQE